MRIKRVLHAIDSRPTRDEEEWLIAITTDHGGIGSGHVGLDQNNRQIFLILAGDGLASSKFAPDCSVPLSHKDIYPSVMEYLRLPS